MKTIKSKNSKSLTGLKYFVYLLLGITLGSYLDTQSTSLYGGNRYYVWFAAFCVFYVTMMASIKVVEYIFSNFK